MPVRNGLCTIFMLCSLLGSSMTMAAGQASANFQMVRDTINGGGGPASSDNFRLSGAVGHVAAAGLMDSANFRLQGGFLNTLALPTMATLLSVMSRKTHGSAGTFDLPIDFSVPVSGAVTVEPRNSGGSHMIVFRFDSPISHVGNVRAVNIAATDVGHAEVSTSGNDAIVALTAIPDGQRLNVTLTGVNGSTNASTSIGFMTGDVNNSRSVNATDIAGIKARSGQTTDTTNFRFDLNASGGINATDIAAVKARSGTVLP